MGQPLFVYINSMLIFGKEPVIVDTVQNLDITTIAACHTPVIEGEYIERAFNRVRQFPTLDPPELPDQSVLDQIIAATSTAAP